MDLAQPFGATPLSEEDRKGLIPTHLSTKAELNAWEQQNILLGEQWAFERRRGDVLSVEFIRDLHRQMFGQTWSWAGQFRRNETNLGVRPGQIMIALEDLLGDARVWIDTKVFAEDEIGARYHHRLVWIHPFANGNGRHARLAADILVVGLGRPRFTWGSGDLNQEGDVRRRYIAALQAADNHEMAAILEFVRA